MPFRLSYEGFPLALEPTDPCPTAVHTETFSTSVFEVLIRIFATTTKICTSACSRQVYTKSFTAICTAPSYSLNGFLT